MLQDSERRLYARQLLLNEIGELGQARLCATRVAVASGDARAREVATQYLGRAGLQLTAAHERAIVEAPVMSTQDVAKLAGDVCLEEAAAWLAGSFAAVEVIKQAAQVGKPARLDDAFLLNAGAR